VPEDGGKRVKCRMREKRKHLWGEGGGQSEQVYPLEKKGGTKNYAKSFKSEQKKYTG